MASILLFAVSKVIKRSQITPLRPVFSFFFTLGKTLGPWATPGSETSAVLVSGDCPQRAPGFWVRDWGDGDSGNEIGDTLSERQESPREI